jgi:hypothetical protein
MDIITTLSIVESLGIISHGAELARLIWLVQDGSSSILRGINFQGVRVIWVWLSENRVA